MFRPFLLAIAIALAAPAAATGETVFPLFC